MKWNTFLVANVVLALVACFGSVLLVGQQHDADMGDGVKHDGVIDEGEYDVTLKRDEGRYTLAWKITGHRIYIAMSAQTTGWVAVGFDPIVVADNADLVFGWVDDWGKVFIVDAHSQGAYGPYPPDAKLGGTNDILNYAGSEHEGMSTLEFSRYLDTGDDHDSAILPRGGNKIIWMYGSVDDYHTRYVDMGYAWLRSDNGVTANRSLLTLLRFLLMALSVAILYFGFFVPASRAAQERKIKTFRDLGLGGVGLGLASAVLTALRAAQDARLIQRAVQLGFSLASAAALLVLGGVLLSLPRKGDELTKRPSIQWSLGLAFVFLLMAFAMDLVSYLLG